MRARRRRSSPQKNIVQLAATQDGGTEIRYASEVTIAGRLGKFGFGIMQKKAEALGEDLASAFRDRVLAQISEPTRGR
jgi:carbon monoxide dehydrogenase subunit G